MTDDNPSAEKYVPTAAQKRLLRLVYIMGLVIVLLFLGLIFGLVWKSMKAKPPVTAEDFSLNLNSPDIRLIDLDGNTLAITTANELLVVDVVKKKVLLRETLR